MMNTQYHPIMMRKYLIEVGELPQCGLVYLAVVTSNKLGLEGNILVITVLPSFRFLASQSACSKLNLCKKDPIHPSVCQIT